MSDPDLDQTAEDLLSAEGAYKPGEWAAIEHHAKELVDEALAAGVTPKHYAVEKMTALVDAMTTGEELSPYMDDLRFDLAVAAALVYVGRIGMTDVAMAIERELAEAEDLIAAWHGVLDAATIGWLDQRAAQVAEAVPLSTLLGAWREDGETLGDDVDPDDVLLGRLVVATAVVAKARPVRIDAGWEGGRPAKRP